MATLADPGASAPATAEQRERRFFLAMAIAIALTVAAGFGLFLVIGISSFTAPWWVHIHAVSFVAWIALFVTQARHVQRGSIASHRKLGRIGALLAVWLVLVGLVLTPVTLAVHRSPPFFTPAQFLALDWANIAAFAGLVGAAVVLRRQTDWHRRLMLCATICVIAPAWGRILVIAGVMTPWHNIFALLAYVAVAMGFDLHNRGRIHPAYFWGAGTLVAMGVSIDVLAGFGPLAAYAAQLSGG